MKKIIRLTESDLVKLVKGIIKEQIKQKLYKDLQPRYVLIVVSKDGQKTMVTIISPSRLMDDPFIGRVSGKPQEKFYFGPAENQIKYESNIESFDYTVESVSIGSKVYPVDQEGNF